MLKGNCYGVDVNVFFPTTKGGRYRKEDGPRNIEAKQRAVVRQYCATCPVIGACRDLLRRYEAETGRVSGVWAGLTEADRYENRHQHKAKVA